MSTNHRPSRSDKPKRKSITDNILEKLYKIVQLFFSHPTPMMPTPVTVTNCTILLAHYLWECKGSPEQDEKGQKWDYYVAMSIIPILLTNIILTTYFKASTKDSYLTDDYIEEIKNILDKSINIKKHYSIYKVIISTILTTPNNHHLYNRVDWHKHNKCNEIHSLFGYFVREQILAEVQYDTVQALDGTMFRMNTEEKILLDHIGYKLSPWHRVSYENINEHFLEELVLKQAELFWRYKGCPKQSFEDQQNDFYNSKRYLAFYIADYLFECCIKNNTNDCPFAFINEEYLSYLISLSIEEFLRHKAYHIWMSQNRPHNTHENDYFIAINYTKEAVSSCKKKCCLEIDMADKFTREISSCPMQTILSGKSTTAIRLISNINKLQIESFASEFYFDYEVDFKDKHNLNPTNYPTNILMNVAEYLLISINCQLIKSLKKKEKE